MKFFYLRLDSFWWKKDAFQSPSMIHICFVVGATWCSPCPANNQELCEPPRFVQGFVAVGDQVLAIPIPIVLFGVQHGEILVCSMMLSKLGNCQGSL